MIREGILLALFLGLGGGGAWGSSLKNDEQLYFSPTYAYKDAVSKKWIAEIHGWVFEPENQSAWRTGVKKALRHPVNANSDSSKRLADQRVGLFLTDNERGKSFKVAFCDQEIALKPSDAAGHIHDQIEVDANFSTGTHVVRLLSENKTGMEIMGVVEFVSDQGLSVISDIDDTIKASDVLDRGQLLENTFSKVFLPIPAMSELYSHWQQQGAVFHYVSSGPWPLVPELERFLREHRFPTGSLHLRHFRWKNKSAVAFLLSSEQHKLRHIENILKTFAHRSFVLVGDSGEKDPEVYGALARRFTTQIKHVYIRDVSPGYLTLARQRSAFKGLPPQQWTVFNDPKELLK